MGGLVAYPEEILRNRYLCASIASYRIFRLIIEMLDCSIREFVDDTTQKKFWRGFA